jgi:hypothetical protein
MAVQGDISASNMTIQALGDDIFHNVTAIQRFVWLGQPNY